nr:unnamed protein product [Digitaria exilis]
MVHGEESSWRMERAALPLNQALAYGVQAHGVAAPPSCYLYGLSSLNSSGLGLSILEKFLSASFACPAASSSVYSLWGAMTEGLCVRNFLSRDFQPAAAAAAYFGFGELEEALIHGGGGGGASAANAGGVDPGVIIKSDAAAQTKQAAAAAAAGYLSGAAGRPPTLEIFPSWPMRHQQQLHSIELVSPASSAPRQEVMMVTTDDYSYKQPGLAAAAPPSFQQHHPLPLQLHGGGDHDKRKQGSTRKDGKLGDAKTERRLAQNREAARKSRLRKKAYVQQLETSRIRLQQVEHELQRARSQGLFVGGCSAAGDMSSGNLSTVHSIHSPAMPCMQACAAAEMAAGGLFSGVKNVLTAGVLTPFRSVRTMFAGAAMFDMEYARWLDDDSKRLAELRGGLQAHLLDGNLGLIVEECMQHYDELFQLKASLARADVFHLLTGSWATPAERCFFWMGGFRPSELLKILIPQLDPLTEQQLLGICNLQQSSEQAEEALFQGLNQLHQSLADTVAAGALNDGAAAPNYMSLMAVALEKLASLESFYQQADNLRQQMLHQMRRILTTRQAARCFLSIGEYYRRLRALSNLWTSRPRDNFIGTESLSPTATELQAMHQHQHQQQSHFSGF